MYSFHHDNRNTPPEEIAKLLIDMGCDYLQGYYYSKPVPAEDYVSFLEKHPQKF